MKFSYTPARLAVLALLSSASCPQLFAQTPSLAPVVVTATRTATPLTEQLSEITLISREDIERSSALSLPQLLTDLPGVQVSPSMVRGFTSSLFIRGSNNQHALVLVDGQRISSATVGATAIEHIPLEHIDRVEILRGAASSLYGSDALGGVIQVFTRQGTQAPAPEAALTLGSYGTRALTASYGGRVEGTRFRISLGSETVAGFSDIKAAKNLPFDSYNPDKDGYRQNNLALSLSQQLSPQLEVGVSYWLSRSTKHSDNANCDPDDWDGTSCTTAFDNRELQRLDALQLRGQYKVSDAWTSSVRLGKTRDDLRSWMFNPAVPEVTVPRYTTEQQQLSWQNDLRVGPGMLMTALEHRLVAVDSTQTFTVKEQRSDSLVLGYQAWLDKHLVQGSVRRDWVQSFPDQQTYSLGYGYKFQPHWVLRTAAGTGFRAPTFNDLYWPEDRANWYKGNPSLKPERSENIELGLSYQHGDTSASATVYRNLVKDLIVNSYDLDPSLAIPVNVKSARLQGLSLQGSQLWQRWTFRAALDVLSARDMDTGLVLPRRVPRTASLDASRQRGNWNYGAHLSMYSHRYNDKANTQRLAGYGLVHLRAGYDLSKQARVMVELKNLFDKDYVVNRAPFSPFNDYGVAGRSVFVTLRYAPKP